MTETGATSQLVLTVSTMDQINIDLCFHDDPDFATDADHDSSILLE